MIAPELAKALNAQIAHEQSNAHYYRAVACYFKRLNLRGFEAFFKKQSTEETTHAEKLIDHLEDRGGTVELQALPAPKNEYASAVEAIKAVAAMERNTTRAVHALHQQAVASKELATEVGLHWIIQEQVEEEAWADELEDLVQKVGTSPSSLYMLDHQWGKRAE
jgi:ferritin